MQENYDVLMSELQIQFIGFMYEKMGQKIGSDFSVGFNSIQLVCDGCGWIKIDGKMYYPEKGHIYLLPANCVQSYGPINNEKTINKYFCHFNAKIGNQNLFDLIDFVPSVMAKDYNEVLRTFYELERLQGREDLVATLRKKQLIIKLMCIFFDSQPQASSLKKPEDSMTIKVTEYINKNLNKNITVADLAALLGYNTNYFTSLFKSYTKMTPKQYIISIKLSKAVALLYDLSLSIADIAERTGFINQYYFSTSFKKVYGLPPTQYREVYIKK